MKKKYTLIFLLILANMDLHAASSDIILKGEIVNIPAKRVYLTDAYRWDVIIDSSEYNGKSFSFVLNSKIYSPFQASISYRNKSGRLQQLIFTFSSPIIVNGSKSVGITSFMLDEGITKLKGDAKKGNSNSLIPLPINSQNQAFEKCQNLNFSSRGLSKENRIENIRILVSYIKRFPYSYYLLTSLFNYRTFYKKDELISMLSHFDQKVHQSNLAIEFNKYIFILACNNCVLPSILVEDNKKTQSSLKYSGGKINMLVFWASWCAPCRKEIPTLKILYQKYSSLGLKMFSISIDNDTNSWNKALKIEKMSWPQYIIPSANIEKIKSEFNFIAIPIIIFVDKQGLELKRFTGFDERNISEFYNLINSKLKS